MNDFDLDEFLTAQFHEAMENFEEGETNEEFQNNLEELIHNLQRKAYYSGWDHATGDSIQVTLTPNQTNQVVRSLLYGAPMTITMGSNT